MKRFGRIMLVTAMTASLVVTPVMATPSVSDLESSKATAEREAQSLQAQLTELLSKMGKLEEDLIATGEEIIQAEADLAEAEETEKEQYEAMKLRIKYLYENGNISEMEALVTSQSFSDLVNKAEYVSEVHSYDRQKLNEYAETKQKIQDLKETLEEEQANLENMQEEYEAQEETLAATLENKRAEIANFDEQLQAAAEAAAAEALARQQAAEQNNNSNSDESNNGNSGSSTNNNTSNNSSNSGSSNTGSTNNSSSNNNTNNSSSSNNSSNSNSGSTGSGSSSGNTSVAQAIVNAAYSQLGVPYVYGGTTPGSAFDCSGLVQYCHRVAGISLPRTSQAQGGCGVAVSNPQPGDIVCYGTHVGIYIGGGQMIHAPKPGDVVKVAAVYGSPWYRRCW